MRAVQLDHLGGPEALRIREIPSPIVQSGQLLIRTVASSVNPVDLKTCGVDRGQPFPITPGRDLAGIVVSSPVPRLSVGDRVIAMSAQLFTGIGTWSDLVALPADLAVPAPAGIPLAHAAGLPLAGLTALQALESLRLAAPGRLLVLGAAGAVGSAFLQLAVAAGHRADALVSRPSHVSAAADLGAKLSTCDPLELPAGCYDAIFDTAGWQRARTDVRRLLLPGGRYRSVAADPLPEVPGATRFRVHESGPDLTRLGQHVDDGTLRLRVAAYHPVEDVHTACRALQAGGHLGKTVLLF